MKKSNFKSLTKSQLVQVAERMEREADNVDNNFKQVQEHLKIMEREVKHRNKLIDGYCEDIATGKMVVDLMAAEIRRLRRAGNGV